MNFDKDLFISYAHLDNKPLNPEQEGWVTRFHRTLEALLSMRMGGEARIWRDKKLSGNDVFAKEILEQFPHTALLVSVVSPRYLDSQWCKDELGAFCQAAEQSGGLEIGNKSRIFKILKLPIDSEANLPVPMQHVLGYEFYTFEDEAPLELDPDYGEKFGQDYNRKVSKLAWDVSQIIKQIQRADSPDEKDALAPGADSPVADESVKPTVYLAQCSYDLRESREKIESELKAHGYPVLPEQTLPNDEALYQQAVSQLLDRCQLAIHLIGNTSGVVLDGPSAKSAVMLQNEIAVEKCRLQPLQRCIWLPAGTRSEQPAQQAFIDALHRDGNLQTGADLITGDLETLKGAMHTALKRLESPDTEPDTPQNDSATDEKTIYLICDQRDRKATLPLRKFLRAQGFEVNIPAFEGDAAEVRTANQKLLASCDAVLVFYGLGDEAWKRTVDSDLKKIGGYRTGPALLASSTVLSEPSTSDKEELLELEPNLINALAGFSEQEITPFVSALKNGGGDT